LLKVVDLTKWSPDTTNHFLDDCDHSEKAYQPDGKAGQVEELEEGEGDKDDIELQADGIDNELDLEEKLDYGYSNTMVNEEDSEDSDWDDEDLDILVDDMLSAEDGEGHIL
jgi:hypothetical protein